MNPENAVNTAKNIAIPAHRKTRTTTSESKQRVFQLYNIFYLSFLEKVHVAMMLETFTKIAYCLECQNSSHDISKRQPMAFFLKTGKVHHQAQKYMLSFIHFKY